MTIKRITTIAIALALTAAVSPAAARRPATTLRAFEPRASIAEQLRARWIDRLLQTHEAGTWAPLRYEPTDEDLRALGLPSRRVLLSRRYPTPTLVTADGRFARVELPVRNNGTKTGNGKGKNSGSDDGSSSPGGGAAPVATLAGAGWFGLRPGAWLLLLDGGGIGWCTMAHVYGSPGSYKISTAGHCGKVGDIATVVAAVGNRSGATGLVLLDFGRFSTSHDGGLGDDWALIDVDPAYQHLVTPTMAAWGGPRGMYTATGDLASVSFPRRSFIPSVSVTPDPSLAQAVVHYGHGTLVGTGGTARAGAAIAWRAKHFMFSGAIAPGDSGSGANTLTGDTLGATMEAAGIITHLWVDPLMRDGIGVMGGTRATVVTASLANGQLVPYPVPVTGAP